MAEELSTPRPVRRPWRSEDERLQPTRVAPPPPTTQSSVSSSSSSSFELLPRCTDKPSSSSVEFPRRRTDKSDISLPICSSKPTGASSSRSAVELDRLDRAGAGGSNEPAVQAPPRPRHALNKIVRAESLRQERSHQPSDVSPTFGAVNHGQGNHSAAASVVASLRDRFEARRAAAASSAVPRSSGTLSTDTSETAPVVAKPDIPPKPSVAAGDDDGQVGRRVKRLQRQPAFREFDLVNASILSATELTRAT